jgi:hypothetical protein
MSKLSTQSFKYFNLFKNYVLKHKALNTFYLKDYGFKFNNNLNLNLINNELQNMSSLNNHVYIEELYNRTINSVDHDVFERSVNSENSIISDTDSIDEFVMKDKDLKQSMVKSQSLNTLSNRGLTKVVKRGFSENKTPIKKSIYAGGSFESLVTKSSIFVDKSLFIKEVIEDDSEVILITMPRRWGKSRNLEMLKRFLEIQVDREGNIINPEDSLNYKMFYGNNKALKPLKISNTTIDVQDKEGEYLAINPKDLQSQFPVIAIDFKDCKGTSFEEVKNRLEGKIKETITEFSYLSKISIPHKNGTIGSKYNDLLEKVESDDIGTGLQTLSELLHTYHNQKAWILIDEYDAAINKAYMEFDEKQAKQTVELFRSVYETTLKENPHLEKGLMTGVNRLAKASIFSGLNNLTEYDSIKSKMTKYYGINQEEMKILIDHFEIDSVKADKIKDWYNGYTFIEEDEIVKKYNIWSVVKYLNIKEFQPYWNESGSSLNNLFKNKNEKLSDKILSVLEYGNTKIKYTNQLSEQDFQIIRKVISGQNDIYEDDVNTTLSYLLQMGYFTVEHGKSTVDEYPYIKTPNNEVRKELSGYVNAYFSDKYKINLENIAINYFIPVLEQTQNNKIGGFYEALKDFNQKLQSQIQNAKSYNKISKLNEHLIHDLVSAIVCMIPIASHHSSDSKAGKGRADIMFDVKKSKIGFIIELKYNGCHKDALKQIQDKAYIKAFSANDYNTLVTIGTNVQDKDNQITIDSEYKILESNGEIPLSEWNFNEVDSVEVLGDITT